MADKIKGNGWSVSSIVIETLDKMCSERLFQEILKNRNSHSLLNLWRTNKLKFQSNLLVKVKNKGGIGFDVGNAVAVLNSHMNISWLVKANYIYDFELATCVFINTPIYRVSDMQPGKTYALPTFFSHPWKGVSCFIKYLGNNMALIYGKELCLTEINNDSFDTLYEIQSID